MNWLLELFFDIAMIFELRSSDPVLVAIKRARCLVVVCFLAGLGFVGLAIATVPDLTKDASVGVWVLVASVRESVSLAFMVAAFACNIGVLWNLWVWYRAYTKPEIYY